MSAVCAGAAAYLAGMRQARRLSTFSDEYKKAFEQIAVRISTSGLSSQEKKEASAHILDILSLAQNDGRSVKEMLGDDPDAFAARLEDISRQRVWRRSYHGLILNIESFANRHMLGTPPCCQSPLFQPSSGTGRCASRRPSGVRSRASRTR